MNKYFIGHCFMLLCFTVSICVPGIEGLIATKGEPLFYIRLAGFISAVFIFDVTYIQLELLKQQVKTKQS